MVRFSYAAAAQFFQGTSPDQRRVAAMYHVDHLTLDEIAEKEGISRATVCRRLEAYGAALERMDLQMPVSPPATTRHVRNISPRLMRSL